MPSISVVIPVYNAGRFLRGCLDSVLAQTFQDYEVIAVDDGSTDDSLAILTGMKDRFQRFQVVAGARRGPGAARNLGIERATGDYLFFLDADDSLEPDAFEHLIGVAGAHDPDWVIGAYRKVAAGNLDYGRTIVGVETGFLSKDAPMDIALRYLKAPNSVPIFNNVWGRLYRRALIETHGIRFDEDVFVGEDICFNYAILTVADRIWFDERIVYNYTVSGSLSSATMDRRVDSILATAAINRIRDFLLKRGMAPDKVAQAVGQGRTILAIIGIVRLATAAASMGVGKALAAIAAVIADPALRDGVRHYDPGEKGSKWLPVFIRLNLPLAALALGWAKGVRRYGLRTCLRKGN